MLPRLTSEAEVDLSIDQGTLVLAPAVPYRVTLRSLLDKVTAQNTHREVSTGAPEGDEAWRPAPPMSRSAAT